MQAIDLFKQGASHTLFRNLSEISHGIGRTPEEVAAYMCVQLGTSGKFGLTGRYTMKGRFTVAQVDKVLRRYIQGYVLCPSCRHSQTVLVGTRMSCLGCNAIN